jgi:hypothetical protein
MNEELAQARQLVELGHLKAIVTGMGYPAQLVEKSRELAYHTLLVGLEPDAKGRSTQMALTFYPMGEKDVENTLLLQYFVDLPFDVDKAGLARVREVLPDINNKVVVGHFGITAGQDRLHYRYVQALRADDIVTAEAVADVIIMASYTPHVFEGVLEELAQGEISVEQARARVEAGYADA